MKASHRLLALCALVALLVPSTADAQRRRRRPPQQQPPQEQPAEQPPEEAPAQPEGEAPAAPEEASAPENLQATQQARQHFTAGVGHFNAHRYREAVREFSLAAEQVPSADLWFNIARAHEELSEYDAAVDYYQRYLRDRVDPPDRRQVEQHIRGLQERAEAARTAGRASPTTGTLRLTANHPGSHITLDDGDAGTAPWPEPREVRAGRHGLIVRRDGYIPFRSEVSVEAGVTTAAYADLVPETRFRSIHADPVFAWIVWGVALGSFGVSIGLAVEASSRQPDLVAAREWAAYSDAALGGAIGLGIVGLIVYFIETRAVGTARVRIREEEESGVRELQ